MKGNERLIVCAKILRIVLYISCLKIKIEKVIRHEKNFIYCVGRIGGWALSL